MTVKANLTVDGRRCIWLRSEQGTAGPLRKNILIVDDINDTGATFNWIKEDWPSGCLPMDTRWGSSLGSAMFVLLH